MSLRQNALLLAVITALVAIAGLWSEDPMLAGAWRLPLGLLLAGLAFEGWMIGRAFASAALAPAGPLPVPPPQAGEGTFKSGVDAKFGVPSPASGIGRGQSSDADAAHDHVPSPASGGGTGRGQATAVLGAPTTLRFALTHRLRRLLTIEIAPDAPDSVDVEGDVKCIDAHPDETTHLDVRVTPRRLGEHRWPDMRMRISGPLNLAWWSRRAPLNFSLKVGPNLLRDHAHQHGAAALGAKPRPAAGAGSEVLQLREYRPGDPLNLVDWKATARTGRLVSRDFTEDQHLEIVIALDVGRASGLRAGELDRLGHYANVAARFAQHAVAQDDRVGLLLFADRPLAALAPARGASAVLRIREMLTSAKPAAAESNPLNAALRIRTLVRHRSLVVMLTDLDDATMAGHLASAARLLLPKHLPLIAALASPEIEQLSHASARNWLDPYESLAAQEYRAQLERNTRALRALGAPALLARPEQLEGAVFQAYADFRVRRRV